jgi:hypothetical protein
MFLKNPNIIYVEIPGQKRRQNCILMCEIQVRNLFQMAANFAQFGVSSHVWSVECGL